MSIGGGVNMKIGVPKEISEGEGRVAITHEGVAALCKLGHAVYILRDAGEKSGITNSMYKDAGGIIVDEMQNLYEESELLIKVKPPTQEELILLQQNQTLFSYLLIERDRDLTNVLLNKKIIGIGYEDVIDSKGNKVLLMPMSEIAGKIAVIKGAQFLQESYGGIGVMLGSMYGVALPEVAIMGGGSVAYGAAEMALGMGCNVTILNRSMSRLKELRDKVLGKTTCLHLSEENLRDSLKKADLLINSIDLMGDKKNHIVTLNMLEYMKKGSVIVDVACDENGAIETSRRTTHKNPIFKEQGIIHCAIPNLPGAVPRTSTFALAEANLPYIIKLAQQGTRNALLNDTGLRKGLSTYMGYLIKKQAAENFSIEYTPFEKAFEN